MHPDLEGSLEQILSSYPFETLNAVKQQPPGRALIPGIDIHDGFYCPVKLANGKQCSHVLLKHSSMVQHLKQHQTVNKPKPGQVHNYPCDCQTISKSPRHYFMVTSRLPGAPENHPNVYTAFIQEELPNVPSKCTESLESLNREELPSLLRGTLWHEYIKDYRDDPKDVINLILHPGQADESDESEVLSRLPNISDMWMAQLGEYHRKSSPNMLKYLNGMPVV